VKTIFSLLLFFQIIGLFKPQWALWWCKYFEQTRLLVVLLYGLPSIVVSFFYTSNVFRSYYLLVWLCLLIYVLLLHYNNEPFKLFSRVMEIFQIIHINVTKDVNDGQIIHQQTNLNNKSSNKLNRYISKQVKTYVWRRDEGKCRYCGSNELIEFDHVVPVSKGGSNTARNIQLLCEKCNRDKSDKI